MLALIGQKSIIYRKSKPTEKLKKKYTMILHIHDKPLGILRKFFKPGSNL